MIDQLISTQGIQASQLTQGGAQTPLSANYNDVMRFNMDLGENNGNIVKHEPLLRDIRPDDGKIDSHLLQERKAPTTSNPLTRLDRTYKGIMSQLNDVPAFDKFFEVHQKDKKAAVRTNVKKIEIEDPAVQMKNLLEEQRDIRKLTKVFTRQISQWHIKTQIWSANIKILTTVVSQASQGFKTLFRSAG